MPTTLSTQDEHKSDTVWFSAATDNVARSAQARGRIGNAFIIGASLLGGIIVGAVICASVLGKSHFIDALLLAVNIVLGFVLIGSIFHNFRKARALGSVAGSAKLRSEEESLRLLLDNVSDYAVFMLDHEGRVLTWNPGAQRLTGFEAAEVLGNLFIQFNPSRTDCRQPIGGDCGRDGGCHCRRQVIYELDQAKSKGRCEEEGWRVRKDGTKFWASIVVTAIRGDDGNLVGFAKVMRDLTERKISKAKITVALDELRDANERINALNNNLEKRISKRTSELNAANARLQETSALQNAILQSANYAIISITTEGVITQFNSTAERWLGYAADEVVGKKTPALWHDNSEVATRAEELSLELGRTIKPGVETFVARARMGLVDENEWIFVRKDGSHFPVSLSVTALKDQNGTITGYLGVIADITERKHLESEREKIFAEMQGTLSEIKVLSGMLPICASCKKVRDDHGYWNQIESYISQRSAASFSHGLCPCCAVKALEDGGIRVSENLRAAAK